MRGIRAVYLSFAAILVFATLSNTAMAADDMAITDMLDGHRAALVTVKFVLSVNLNAARNARENESEQEQTCTMVSADGLVVCSNNQLNGFVNIIARAAGPGGTNMTSAPRDFEVLLADQDQSFDAQIVAVDTELDMVWVRITEPGDTTFAYVDFNNDEEAGIGDPVVSIRRLGASYGREPMVKHARIGAVTNKPRKLYFLDTSMEQGAGVPVFSATGSVIGMIITHMPEPTGTRGSMSMMMGGAKELQDAIRGQVLPASEVFKATQRALETLATE